MWGLVILVKGSVTLWLLLSLSTIDFVVVKSGTILDLDVGDDRRDHSVVGHRLPPGRFARACPPRSLRTHGVRRESHGLVAAVATR